MPATDAGVALQFGLLLVATGWAGWMSRSNRDVLRLVVGLTLLLAGLMAVRAIH